MSGTSSDGVDAALVEFFGNPYQPIWNLHNYLSVSYPQDLRSYIIDVSQGLKLSSKEWLDFSEAITEFHAIVARKCDSKSLARIVGCHGQTVWHRPPVGSTRGASLQILQAPLLATLLNKPVIYDFRSKDLALGGHGAPLVPLPDMALIGRGNGWRGVLNLGGIANISMIPPRSGPNKNETVFGWDCGPANSLIDLAVQKISKGKSFFDRDGIMAKKGVPNSSLISLWLKEPFFQIPPPKSTGREYFGMKDLDQRLSQLKGSSDNDVIATLASFSASVIAQDLDHLFFEKFIRPIEIFIAGGGANNLFLLSEIRRLCRGIKISTIKDLGIPLQGREAIVFALLAWWNRLNVPGSTKSTTGISRPVILGIEVKPN